MIITEIPQNIIDSYTSISLDPAQARQNALILAQEVISQLELKTAEVSDPDRKNELKEEVDYWCWALESARQGIWPRLKIAIKSHAETAVTLAKIFSPQTTLPTALKEQEALQNLTDSIADVPHYPRGLNPIFLSELEKLTDLDQFRKLHPHYQQLSILLSFLSNHELEEEQEKTLFSKGKTQGDELELDFIAHFASLDFSTRQKIRASVEKIIR